MNRQLITLAAKRWIKAVGGAGGGAPPLPPRMDQ